MLVKRNICNKTLQKVEVSGRPSRRPRWRGRSCPPTGQLGVLTRISRPCLLARRQSVELHVHSHSCSSDIDVVRSIHTVKGKAAASRDTALLTLVAIFILLPCLLYPYSLNGSIPPLFEGQDITGCVISFDSTQCYPDSCLWRHVDWQTR